jgi:hypothetical protein
MANFQSGKETGWHVRKNEHHSAVMQYFDAAAAEQSEDQDDNPKY